MRPLGILVLALILYFVVRDVLRSRVRRPPPPRPRDEPPRPPDDVIDVEVIERK